MGDEQYVAADFHSKDIILALFKSFLQFMALDIMA